MCLVNYKSVLYTKKSLKKEKDLSFCLKEFIIKETETTFSSVYTVRVLKYRVTYGYL